MILYYCQATREDDLKRIYDKSMGKFTIRLDNSHLEILKKIIKDKKLNSKSEAIRYLIENYQTKK